MNILVIAVTIATVALALLCVGLEHGWFGNSDDSEIGSSKNKQDKNKTDK